MVCLDIYAPRKWDAVVWSGHKATFKLAFCSPESTAAASEDRLRMERLLWATGSGGPKVRLVSNRHRVGL